jgi:hypothetical protein
MFIGEQIIDIEIIWWGVFVHGFCELILSNIHAKVWNFHVRQAAIEIHQVIDPANYF